MYEEAESLSSSILKQILGNIDDLSEEALGDHQLFHDMLESAGMVLVQSLPGLARYYFRFMLRDTKGIYFLPSYFPLWNWML